MCTGVLFSFSFFWRWYFLHKTTQSHCLCICRYWVPPRVSKHAKWDAGGRTLQWGSHTVHQRAGPPERGKTSCHLQSVSVALVFTSCFSTFHFYSWLDSACDVWSRRSFCDTYLSVLFLVCLLIAVFTWNAQTHIFVLYSELMAICFSYSMNNGHTNYMSKLRNHRYDGSDT